MSTRDLRIMACTFCRDPLFWRWLEALAERGGVSAKFDEESAKAFILSVCQVGSRNELDTNEAAARDFHRMVREPYVAWKEAHDGQ